MLEPYGCLSPTEDVKFYVWAGLYTYTAAIPIDYLEAIWFRLVCYLLTIQRNGRHPTDIDWKQLQMFSTCRCEIPLEMQFAQSGTTCAS